MTDTIRIGVVDHYPIYRDAVVEAIRGAEGMTVVATGTDGKDAERMVSRCHILLLEAAVQNSLNLVKTLAALSPETKIVFLSAAPDDEHAYQAVMLGVHGYLTKAVTGSELTEGLRKVYAGGRQIAPDLGWRLVAQDRSVLASKLKPVVLGSKERRVLEHTSQGLTNAQMAIELGLSIAGIKRIKTSLFRRLGVRNRMQAIANAHLVNKTTRN